ncbi:hypothetical protein JCM30760_27200 [Thiomicrorhabdus hydrogeniphila]
MKSQKEIVNSDWEGGKPFLSKTENEEVSIEADYYKGREYLFDPKAQKPQSTGFFARRKRFLTISGLSIFVLLSLFSDNGVGESIGITLFLMMIIVGFVKFNEMLDSGSADIVNQDSITETDDIMGRNFSINTADKLFTDDRDMF